MREIEISRQFIDGDAYGRYSKYDTSRDPFLDEMVERLADKKQVFVKFPDQHHTHPRAIALVRKMTTDTKTEYYGQHKKDQFGNYVVHLKWSDRKNTAAVRLNYWEVKSFLYLPDYNGDTVWTKLDKKKFVEDKAKLVYDRLGHEIKVGDVVTYINARYGEGTTIDFGVVQKIEHKVDNRYHGGPFVTPIVHIKSIAVGDEDTPKISKIKKPRRSIMVMTDIDLNDEAFVAKLTVPQN